MRTVVRLGPIRVHWEVLLVALVVAAAARPSVAVGLLVAIVLHEVGHAVAARAFPREGSEKGIRIQLGSGAPYLGPEEVLHARDAAVLLAGPLLGGALAGLAGHAAALEGGAALRDVGAMTRALAGVWTAYQLAPLPVTDGGVLLRRGLSPRLGALPAWRLSWAAGLLYALGFVLWSPYFLEPVVWLLGLSVILGRSEWGHVRHLEAWQAYRKGDLSRAVSLATVEHLPQADRARLAELGLHAALELDDVAGVERLVDRLGPAHPLRLEAVTWLLRKDRDLGALLAERTHDAVDAGKAAGIDRERYGDLSFRHAILEASRLRPESALGLIERALDHGFDDRDRLLAEGALDRLRGHPRFVRLLERLPGEA